jgi:hypothetical protein
VAKETHGEKKPIKTIHANYPTRREEAMHVYYWMRIPEMLQR